MTVQKAIKLLGKYKSKFTNDEYLQAVDVLKDIPNAVVFISLPARKRDMWLQKQIQKASL
jgi:hypothetical protein